MLSTIERDPFAIPRILWKRKLWVLVFLVLGLAGGVLALKSLPPMYEASTMILVEAQQIPKEYVKTTVTSNLTQRLRTIQQQITNRENLERIVHDLDLYPELRQVAPMEEVVARARRALTIKVERGRTFRVTFRGKDRFEVAKAANRIAELFLLENLNVRASQAEKTSEFLEVELVGHPADRVPPKGVDPIRDLEPSLGTAPGRRRAVAGCQHGRRARPPVGALPQWQLSFRRARTP